MSDLLNLYQEQIEELTVQVTEKGYDFSYVMEELSSIQLSLLDHPEENLFEFNVLYATLQSHVSRVTNIILDLRAEKQFWISSFKYQVDKLFYKLRFNLLSSRIDIKALKTQELREAAISTELESIVEIRDIIEKAISDIDYLIKQCEIKRDDLDKANTNMSRQQRVIESLIGLGYLNRQI